LLPVGRQLPHGSGAPSTKTDDVPTMKEEGGLGIQETAKKLDWKKRPGRRALCTSGILRMGKLHLAHANRTLKGALSEGNLVQLYKDEGVLSKVTQGVI